jgi:galactonate dehydratase
MKITDIKSFIVSAHNDNWVYIKVYTDEGITGIGECSLETREQTVVKAVEEYKRHVIGLDPFDTEKVFYLCYRDAYWGAGPVLISALSAIDCALWDIKGKALSVPVYKLIGGKFRDKIRVYANRWFLGAKTPDELAKKAEETVKAGFTALKWDPFGVAEFTISNVEMCSVLKQIKAIKDAVGENVDLLIEGHGRFNQRTALQIAEEIAFYKPMFFEEPVMPENLDALAEVKAKSPVPIAVGERLYTKMDFRSALSKNAMDIAQPDIRVTGGLTECKKIAALAEVNFIPVAPHNIHGQIGTAASVHLACSIPNALILEYSVENITWKEELFTHQYKPVDGYISINDRPGFGIDLNDAAAENYPYRTISMVQTLFKDTF